MRVLRFSRPFGTVALSVTVSLAFLPIPSAVRLTRRPIRPPAAAPALDTAIARMGGEDALRRIERVRFEMMTLWQRMSFEPRQSDLIGLYGRTGSLDQRLESVLSELRARERYANRLLVKSDGRVTVLQVKDVEWIEAADNSARVHRSAIVNLARVRELQPMFGGEYVIILSTGAKLTLSRGYRDAFRDRLGSEL